MPRSKEHPLYYKVGSLPEGDVYWHPFLGFSTEREWGYLVELPVAGITDMRWACCADLAVILAQPAAQLLWEHVPLGMHLAIQSEVERLQKEEVRYGGGHVLEADHAESADAG
jgi:hypothetical protein